MRPGVVCVISALIVMALHVDQSEGWFGRRAGGSTDNGGYRRGGFFRRLRNKVRNYMRPAGYGQGQYGPPGGMQGGNQLNGPLGGMQPGNGCPYQDPAEQDARELPREFSEYDENSDGSISREEFNRVLATQDKMAAADQADTQELVGEKRMKDE